MHSSSSRAATVAIAAGPTIPLQDDRGPVAGHLGSEHLKSALGIAKPEALDTHTIQRFCNSLSASGQSPKSGKNRTILPAPIVMDALCSQQQWEQSLAGGIWENKFNLVFTDATGKYLVRRTVVKHFKKISQRANLSDDARFHDLRHSFAVTSLYAGDDIKTVQANLGHATAQFTLDVYGHVTQKMRQDSASRMQKFYEQLNTKNGQ